jgi:hypothetical protein
MLDGEQVFVVRDSVLDVIDVEPVYFSDTKVVVKSIPNGTVLLSKPVPGAYAGMLVKPYGISADIEGEQTDSSESKKAE